MALSASLPRWAEMWEIHEELSPYRGESLVEDHTVTCEPTPPYNFPANTPSHSSIFMTYSFSFSGNLVPPDGRSKPSFMTRFRVSTVYVIPNLTLIHSSLASQAKVVLGFPISALRGFDQASPESMETVVATKNGTGSNKPEKKATHHERGFSHSLSEKN